MSGRIAYVERVDRTGDATRIRLVGERHDEVFETGGPIASSDAAGWLIERLPKGATGTPTLDLLCVDVEGSLCSWITTPTTDQSVIDVLARQRPFEMSTTEESGSEEGTTVLGFYAGVPQDSSVQALAVAAEKPPRRRFSRQKTVEQDRKRVPVLAGADVGERLLLDAIDARGGAVTNVCSLWHAMAAAWDQRESAAQSASADNRVVAAGSVPVACVLLDPRGRLLWTWSQGGALVAAGSILLRQTAGEHPTLCIHAHDVSRVAAEWLSWSAQLSVVPQRIIAVSPELLAESPGELDVPRFGATLAGALHGAPVDLAVDADPLGATFRRLAAQATNAQESGVALPARDPTQSLVGLTRRPGRSHFRLYVWSALAVAVGAAGVFVETWRLRSDANAARNLAQATTKQWRESFADLKVTYTGIPGQELLFLEGEVAKLEKQFKGVENVSPAMPVLQELDALSYVLTLEDFDLVELTLDSKITPRLVVMAPNINKGEDLYAAVQQIAGSVLQWKSSNFQPPRPPDNKVRCTFDANWPAPARTPQSVPREPGA